MKFGPYEPLLPNKIALGLQISHRTASGDFTRYVNPDTDLSKCVLKWRNLLVGSTSKKVIAADVNFSVKQNACNNTAFQQVSSQITNCASRLRSRLPPSLFCLSHIC